MRLERKPRLLRRVIVAAVLAFAASAPAADLDTLSGARLQEHCRAYAENPASKAGLACEAYVRGFIEGIVSTDAGVLLAGDSQRESFTERALRTRLGAPTASEPSYCLDSATSLEQIIGQLLAHAEESPAAEDASASETMRSMLSRFHPC